jgi:hypothetical protein
MALALAKSREDLALSRSARQWMRRQRDRLQLIGGTKPGASSSLPSKLCTASSSSGCPGATSCGSS